MRTKNLLLALIGMSFGIKAQNIFPTTGNVGIGTTNPNSKLHINSTGSKAIRITRGGAHIFGYEIGGSTFGLYDYTTGHYRWRTGNGNVFLVESVGNVGIGTVNPSTKLYVAGIPQTNGEIIHVRNTVATGTNRTFGGIKFSSAPGFDWVIGKFSDKGIGKFQIRDQANTERFTLMPSGNVGIGTTNPNSKLHIYDNSNYTEIFLGQQASSDKTGIVKYLQGNGSGSGILQLGNWGDNLNTNGLNIKKGGNIGIGTNNPGIWKLAVNGQIRAKEIKVETGWSDFVFENNYKLPTLKNVENHIKEKGHLKDIPSAKEVEKNGIFLGAMDAKLLQKIEELTLYTIQQQKEIEVLKLQNKKLLELEKRLEKLEKK